MGKWRIDEWPVIFNVFQGETSFVRGRSKRPFFDDRLLKKIPFHALRPFATLTARWLTMLSIQFSMIVAK
jgi:lipopolysaccharide/colanic/teichoic acid biosynthesis glycosyltransferase